MSIQIEKPAADSDFIQQFSETLATIQTKTTTILDSYEEDNLFWKLALINLTEQFTRSLTTGNVDSITECLVHAQSLARDAADSINSMV